MNNADVEKAEGDFSSFGVWIVAGLTLLVHLAVAGRYDFFRNELYFIICGRHPAFGYVDQPPLVPLVAAATQIFGNNHFLLRVPAALSAAALVPVTAALARVAGGTRFSMIIAGIAAAIAPGLIAVTSTFGTPTTEALSWTLCAYFVLRAASRRELRAFVWAGVVAGISLEIKYGIAIWLVGLFIGVAISNARSLLASRGFLVGAALAILIALPSFIWQLAHGVPFLAVVAHHNVEGRQFAGSPVGFLVTQTLAINIVLAPLWLAGLIAPFVFASLRSARILSVAYLVAATAIIAAHGKDYYLFPAYPALFAVGAVALTRLYKWVQGAWIAFAIANSALILPMFLPVLPPDALYRYLNRNHLSPPPNEAAAIGASITQVFSDEYPWRDLEAKVTRTWYALPAEERAHTAIFGPNYGEAAAIDFYGRKDGLPETIGAQNNYFLWGTHGFVGGTLIIINGDEEYWRNVCTTLTTVGTFGARYAMPYENNRPIRLCRGLKMPLAQLWPGLRWYW